MVMFTRVNGKMTRLTDLELICTQMEHSTKVTGRRTSSMGTERRPGLMGLATKASMLRAKRTAREDSSGLMDPPMKANSSIII